LNFRKKLYDYLQQRTDCEKNLQKNGLAVNSTNNSGGQQEELEES